VEEIGEDVAIDDAMEGAVNPCLVDIVDLVVLE
jgi:hypothetical protein